MIGRLRLPALLVAAAALLGCAQDTALVVNVQALAGVHDEEGNDPIDLLVTFQSSKAPAGQQHILSAKGDFYLDPSRQTTRFSVIANGHAGPVSITAEARNADQRPAGSGVATAILQDGETVETEMVLYPSDMQVNTQFANSQILPSLASARHLASDVQGNFITLWEEVEQCNQSGGLRCDIFGRLYDNRAVPRINGAFGSADQFVANPNTTFYDLPAVAMQRDGRYLTAWLQGFSDRSVITIRSFMADGTLDANMTESEVTLSSDQADNQVANPDVAALPNGNYLVAWAESFGGTAVEIRSRIVTPSGAPADGGPNPTAVTRIDPVPAWLSGQGTFFVGLISVAAAAGPDGNAMVAWSEPCDDTTECWELKVRPYVHSTAGYGALQTSSAMPTGKVGFFDIAGLPYGYALAWGDQVSADSNEGYDVLLRRFGLDGTPLDEDGFVVNTSRQGLQGYPAIASNSDGTLLVAWYTGDGEQDPEGGIRARALMANGLPVGRDFAANTTSRGVQAYPSLAPGAGGAYIIAFQDGSEVGPDKLSSGIRVRLLYPDFDTQDGQVGSLCAQRACQPGLYCMAMPIAGRVNNEQRCVDECQGPGALCPNGGRCLQLPDQAKYVCVYNQ